MGVAASSGCGCHILCAWLCGTSNRVAFSCCAVCARAPTTTHNRSMHHPNRFVRETAHFTAATLCQALQGERLVAVGPDLAERLADGLSDNWSQVRVVLGRNRPHVCAFSNTTQGASQDFYSPQTHRGKESAVLYCHLIQLVQVRSGSLCRV